MKQLKKFLKLILPIVWLKKIFIVYNRTRINTIDKVLFPEYILNQNDFIFKTEETVYDNLHIDESKLSDEIQNKLKLWHAWTQDEYLLIFDRACVIEPSQGWALTNTKLIYYSLGFGRAEYVPKPDFLRLHFLKKQKNFYKEIVSLRDTGEENYFHFYNDILAKLCYLDEHLKLPADIPILIADKLYTKPYFQYYLKNSTLLKHRNWVIQKDEFIVSNRVYFCKPLTHKRKNLERIVASLNIKNEHTPLTHKIFIYRNPKRLRYILNFEEVSSLCKTYGFQLIDPDLLSMTEQIFWFSRATHIVGIHGAGLVNMIYGQSTIKKIIEIFPPSSYAPFHYIMLAKIYNFEYDAIMGKTGKDNFTGGFIVNIDELEKKIKDS